MKFTHIAPLFALIAFTPFVKADEIRLKDGSVIKGKILGLEQVEEDGVTSGVFSMQSPSMKGSDKTPVKIPQNLVSTFSTDGDFIIATAGQTEAHGKVESAGEGVKVSTPDGLVISRVDNLKDAWIPGADSPADKARKKLERRWEYTVDLSIIGKTGNGESIGESTGFTALNKGPDDELKFYGKHNYSKARAANSATGWQKTADDLHAGVEYTSLFSRPLFWYVRSDNGYDRVRQITFFSTDAVGVGTMIIDNKKQHLSIRAGAAYRFERYRPTAGISDTNAPGIDIGLHHDCEFEYFKMINDLSATPSVNDFKNVIAVHDSSIETPLANTEDWKLRVGVRNEYRSRVIPGLRPLDTTYYVKLVYTWK